MIPETRFMPHNTPKNRTLQLPTNSTSLFSAYRHNTSRRLRKVDFLSHYIHMRRAAHIVWLLLAVLVRQSGLCALLPGTVLPQAALAAPPAPLSGNRSDTVQHVELSFRFEPFAARQRLPRQLQRIAYAAKLARTLLLRITDRFDRHFFLLFHGRLRLAQRTAGA